MLLSLPIAGAIAALSSLVSAHPGAHEHVHLSARELQAQHKRIEQVGKCDAALAKRHGALREERELSLARRTGFEARAFYPEFQNTTCLLSPEVTEGPYYVGGEQHRNNITESQGGLALLLDIGIMNTQTCEPLVGVFVDIWFANASGYYSGYENVDPITGQSVGEGNCDGSSDPTLGVDDCLTSGTFLRGFYETDSNGIVEFASTFPGWYVDRATHIHVKVHVNSTLAANGTLIGGEVIHVGQIFFDQDLLTEVYSTIDPYVPWRTGSNQTANVDDMWFTAQEETGMNAVASTAYLGASLADGLVGYITLGVDAGTDVISSYVNSTSVPLYSGNSTGSTNETAVASGSAGASSVSSTSTGAAASSESTSGTTTSSATRAIRALSLPAFMAGGVFAGLF